MVSFVTFEGIDGTGKSTVSKGVLKMLQDEGVKVKWTREPSDSWLGDLVKGSFDKDVSPFSEALLFCADRAEHTRRIQEWLDEGHNVLCDRYVDSTVAYQGAVLKDLFKGDDLLAWLEGLNAPYIREPDLTLLFVASPEVCLERIGTRDRMTKFERLGTLRQVEANYMVIKEGKDRFVTIDAERLLDEVVAETHGIVKAQLKKERV